MQSGAMNDLDEEVTLDLRRRSFHHADWALADLCDAKAGRRLSVCLPARNEAATVGDIVSAIRRRLVLDVPLVDEIVVMDDHSTDATAQVAADAGARVVAAREVLPMHGEGHGKGEVLWKSLFVAEGDLIVWCDADIRQFSPRFVVGVAGPLVADPTVAFSKGWYRREEHDGTGGGRVTELVARPLLSMFFPALRSIRQPLSGEYGGRRDVLEQLPFVEGYGVDIGLLIDVAAREGIDSIAQVDLDVRHHRNRPLSELSPQAMAVAGTILHKAQPGLVDADAPLLLPDGTSVPVAIRERPPLVELADQTGKG
jgi:glucosyl-3-phosphoglycerate synthase